ncbi:MAG: FIST N-terminal domain-containing protein [Polyangiaceae bacterium]
MKVAQELWTLGAQTIVGQPVSVADADLVIGFGSPQLLAASETWQRLRAKWGRAHIVACSTAGEISGTQVFDDSLAVTAIRFEGTPLRCAQVVLTSALTSAEAGKNLAEQLLGPNLRHVFVLSDGLKVNGSELVAGMIAALPAHVSLSGGLSGDGDRFQRTYVCVDGFDELPRVAALGFYGDRLEVRSASLGGWDPFGPERRVTRSKDNVLYELDGQPALDLYEQYLGEHAANLPASGLSFPLSVRVTREQTGVVRTILAMDRAERSLTFAGDIPTGAYARLMCANFERLVQGAEDAARTCHDATQSSPPDLAILISCVGRKLVLKQRVEEEVEGAGRILGDTVRLTGFYSYGEISPFTPTARCELHNQTMTITTFRES